MWEPYENQLIGAFIYAVGYAGGQRANPTMSVNLFQQTPLDRSFSDLIVGATNCLVLEFKRNRRAIATEHAKWPHAGLEHFMANPRWQAVSRAVHFVVYGASTGNQVDMKWCPYSDVLRASNDAQIGQWSVQALISYLYGALSDKKQIGVSPTMLQAYLRAVARFRVGSASDSSSRWLGIMQVEGQFVFHTADSLAQLLAAEQMPAPPERELHRDSPGFDLGM